jgi:tetratricopeptide (TPR) repeat protein
MTTAQDETTAQAEKTREAAQRRLASTGRNDLCSCGSNKKYKKCHLFEDEKMGHAAAEAPNAQLVMAQGWRLFEQRRPGAAEREFKAALALDPDLMDAHVGIGMARLSSGNSDGARTELEIVSNAGAAAADELRGKNVKDAFSRTEAQSFIRACHALGCLAYDQERYEDAARELERVYSIDEGNVGSEARLIAAKAMMKQEKAAEAAAILEPAVAHEVLAGRAKLGLSLALFSQGKEAEARTALGGALASNPHFGRALLGKIRKQVENLAGATAGSLEEAVVYNQTFGDVWTDAAKAFLEKALSEKAGEPAAT